MKPNQCFVDYFRIEQSAVNSNHTNTAFGGYLTKSLNSESKERQKYLYLQIIQPL